MREGRKAQRYQRTTAATTVTAMPGPCIAAPKPAATAESSTTAAACRVRLRSASTSSYSDASSRAARNMPSVIFIDPLPPKVAQARAVQPVPTLPQERLSITPHCCRASHRGLQEPPALGWGEREINVECVAVIADCEFEPGVFGFTSCKRCAADPLRAQR